MSKRDKEFEARMQGMRYAFDLVKVGMARLGEVVVVALGGLRMKEKHFYFYKYWFVFPLCITLHTNCMEYYPPAKRMEIHFLWWHWKWTFEQEGD